MVKFGVIGCGVIGTQHITNIIDAPETELVAVADLVESYRLRAIERFQPPKVYHTGVELISDPEIEAVVLAFPTAFRTEIAKQALISGKHVLIEKPIAMNSQEVEELIAIKGDLVSGCCSCRYRLFDGADFATKFISTGKLGELRSVFFRELRAIGGTPKSDLPPDWRLKKSLNGGGILVNWSSYDLDFLLGLTDWKLKPLTVFAQTWPIPKEFSDYVVEDSDAEIQYTALIRCQNGITISVERGEYMPTQTGISSSWEIIGSRGSLKMNMLKNNPYRLEHTYVTKTGLETEIIYENSERPNTTPVEDFARAIKEKKQPKTSLENALIIQKITDGIYASAAQAQSVQLDEL